MVYINDDVGGRERIARKLQRNVTFRLKDLCYSPLFSSNDISIQKIKVGKGHKEWVALVKLDSATPTGYIRNELAQCKNLEYLPRTKVEVEVFYREQTPDVDGKGGDWEDITVRHP